MYGSLAPEAYLGGPIALVEEGDMISIDIPAGTIDLVVSPDIVESRKKSRRVPDHTALVKGGLLERYRRLVGSAIRGAVYE
ncbi:MAG: dihydroxy-acid dehydratase [Desulfobacterales bacterium]|nr:dihydroxy-acid dehydratase [Desulfobacterales bacterium]